MRVQGDEIKPELIGFPISCAGPAVGLRGAVRERRTAAATGWPQRLWKSRSSVTRHTVAALAIGEISRTLRNFYQ